MSPQASSAAFRSQIVFFLPAQALRPRYWFAGHLHVAYPAVVPHDADGSTLPVGAKRAARVTRFLATDKPLPRRKYVQVRRRSPARPRCRAASTSRCTRQAVQRKAPHRFVPARLTPLARLRAMPEAMHRAYAMQCCVSCWPGCLQRTSSCET